MAGSPARAAELPAPQGAGDVQPARVPFVASDRDDDAGELDSVAGCEFVDDRIRLPE
jgi:hypothetical protein